LGRLVARACINDVVCDMSDFPRKEGNGTLAWRTIYSVGLALLSVLSYGVYDSVRETSRAVNALQVELGKITGSYGTRLEDHERRIGKLEEWREKRGNP
jgi:hypothetical protein